MHDMSDMSGTVAVRRRAGLRSHFPSPISGLVLAAISSLEKLEDEKCTSAARVAAVVREDDALSFWEDRGFKISNSTALIWRLPGITNRPEGWRYGSLDTPPGNDHPVLLLKNSKPAIFQTEPYDLDTKTVALMSEFAVRHNLEFCIDNRFGLHFPGVCLAVRWWVRGSDPWQPYPCATA